MYGYPFPLVEPATNENTQNTNPQKPHTQTKGLKTVDFDAKTEIIEYNENGVKNKPESYLQVVTKTRSILKPYKAVFKDKDDHKDDIVETFLIVAKKNNVTSENSSNITSNNDINKLTTDNSNCLETSIDKSIEKIVQNNADNLTLDSSNVQTISKENSNSFATNILPIAVYRIASDESLASDIFDNNKGKVWL